MSHLAVKRTKNSISYETSSISHHGQRLHLKGYLVKHYTFSRIKKKNTERVKSQCIAGSGVNFAIQEIFLYKFDLQNG